VFTFNAPSESGEVLAPRDLVGQLLIIHPRSVDMVKTQAYGEKEAVRVDVAVLTQQNQDGSYGVAHRDVLWFSGRIIGSLKRQLGSLVLARMAIGTGKPGQNPPFELDDATQDAQAVTFAEGWINQHPEFMTIMQAPAAQAASAAVPAPMPPVPAAVPAAVPMATPVPAALPQPAPTPTAAPAPQVIAAAVWDALDPAVQAQMAAAGMSRAA
jgi:hypothetical protein